VYARDRADVSVGRAFRRDDASYHAGPAVYDTVQKQYGGNTLEAIWRVKEMLAQIAVDLPANIHLREECTLDAISRAAKDVGTRRFASSPLPSSLSWSSSPS